MRCGLQVPIPHPTTPHIHTSGTLFLWVWGCAQCSPLCWEGVRLWENLKCQFCSRAKWSLILFEESGEIFLFLRSTAGTVQLRTWGNRNFFWVQPILQGSQNRTFSDVFCRCLLILQQSAVLGEGIREVQGSSFHQVGNYEVSLLIFVTFSEQVSFSLNLGEWRSRKRMILLLFSPSNIIEFN